MEEEKIYDKKVMGEGNTVKGTKGGSVRGRREEREGWKRRDGEREVRSGDT